MKVLHGICTYFRSSSKGTNKIDALYKSCEELLHLAAQSSFNATDFLAQAKCVAGEEGAVIAQELIE